MQSDSARATKSDRSNKNSVDSSFTVQIFFLSDLQSTPNLSYKSSAQLLLQHYKSCQQQLQHQKVCRLRPRLQVQPQKLILLSSFTVKKQHKINKYTILNKSISVNLRKLSRYTQFNKCIDHHFKEGTRNHLINRCLNTSKRERKFGMATGAQTSRPVSYAPSLNPFFFNLAMSKYCICHFFYLPI